MNLSHKCKPCTKFSDRNLNKVSLNNLLTTTIGIMS